MPSWKHRVKKKRTNSWFCAQVCNKLFHRFQVLSMTAEFEAFKSKLSSFIHDRCNQLPTFAFWMSYLHMADLLLNFIRATREGNWALHLDTAAKIVPWYFAYDHLNYARYLPVYIHEMLAIPETHPSVAEPLASGEFVFQQQEQHSFSQTSMDQVIEQTINRDSKTRGGQNAVHRWILSYKQRAEISRNCTEMAGKTANCQEKKDLSKSRCKKDEEDVQSVMHTIMSMQNPFTYYAEELINVASGQVAPPEVTDDLLTAHRKGCTTSSQFVEDRLISRQVEFHAPLRTMKLKTFMFVQKQDSGQKHLQETDRLKVDKDLMARLLVVARNRTVDLKDLLTHCLSQFPHSLNNSNGSLQRTNKATLLHHLEAKFPEMIVTEIPLDAALILDGMAVIQQLAEKVPATFGDLSIFIFRHIIKLACFYMASRVDFVCDRYSPHSIKDGERRRRSSATGCLQRALNENQKTPNQFRKFLMVGKNKESLAAFLTMQWRKMSPEELCGKTVYTSFSQQCFRLSPQDDMTGVITETVQELASDHEEADTLVLLQAKHASTFFSSIVIKTPDTDIFLLCLAHQHQFNTDLHVSTGTGSASRLLSVRPVAEKCGQVVSSALLSLHAFTGCDSVSCFKGKGKVKSFQLMQESEEFLDTFRLLGTSWDVTENLLQQLEKFVCFLFGQKTVSSVNDARVNIFKATGKFDSLLPPSSDSLKLHAARANYQAIWRNCLQASINAPSPTFHGWKLQNQELVVQWSSLPSAPSALSHLVKCSCKKNNCNSRHCSCVSQRLPCTSLCQCLNCSNKVDVDTEDSQLCDDLHTDADSDSSDE